MKWVGILIVIFALLLSLAPTSGAQTTIEAPGSVLTAPGGRYVFGQVSNFVKNQYMLDTKTGRLWLIVMDSEGSPVLEPIPYIQWNWGNLLKKAQSPWPFDPYPRTDKKK